MEMKKIKNQNEEKGDNKFILLLSKKNFILYKLIPLFLMFLLSIIFLITFNFLKNKFLKIVDVYKCLDLDFTKIQNSFCEKNFKIILKKKDDSSNFQEKELTLYNINNLISNKEQINVDIQNYYFKETNIIYENLEYSNVIFYHKLTNRLIFLEFGLIVLQLILLICLLFSFKFSIFNNKILSLIFYILSFILIYEIHLYSNLFFSLYIANKSFQNLINLLFGSGFTLFLIIFKKEFKINFL